VAGLRSAATLAFLCGVLVIGGLWGWSAVTAPFPKKADAPVCESTRVSKGDKIYPAQVVVSVFNAGTRPGLASRTMQLFQDGGFHEGDSGNAPEHSNVPVAQVWTKDPHNPAVKLVGSRLGPHKVLKKKAPGAGVTVVVGDGFDTLVKGPRFVVAHSDTEICSPPVD
jgi:hypothetical protein